MKEKDARWFAIQAMDILAELRERQFLLEVLDEVIGDAYFDADDDTREGLTKISTVLRVYDNDRVTDSLKKAIAFLGNVRSES